MEMLLRQPGRGKRSVESKFLPTLLANLNQYVEVKAVWTEKKQKTQGVKFSGVVLNYRKTLFHICCKLTAGRECRAIFHYRVESENPYLSFSMPSAYSKLLLQGITGWVGRALSLQKWETTQTTL